MITKNSHQNSHLSYRPDIDGLRAIAVLAVVIFHAFPKTLAGGFIGVDIFFVLSGYLISTILFRSLDAGQFSLLDFYVRRTKRIFPALLLVLVSCLGLGWFALLSDEYQQLGKHVAAGAGFVANLVLWSEAGYFDVSADLKPLLHLWSLGIEEQFYLVWPILLWLAWQKRWPIFGLIAALGALSFGWNVYGVQHDAVATFYAPYTRFWELLAGSALAWLTLYRHPQALALGLKIEASILSALGCHKAADGSRLSNGLSVLGLGLLLVGFWCINKETIFPGWWALMPVLATVLMITAGQKAWVNRVVLSNKVAVWFGLISYPLYLWHWPLLSFLRIFEGNESDKKTAIAVLMALVLAYLTYRFVERPLRFGRQGQAKVFILVALMAVVGLTGVIVSQMDFAHSNTANKAAINRNAFKHAFGVSSSWVQGKADWLFLGDGHNKSIAKLTLAMQPKPSDVDEMRLALTEIAQVAQTSNTKVVLMLGPDKPSIYPEYLPDEIVPSPKKYISFYLDAFKTVPNLTVYDPTQYFLGIKEKEGLLYWRTDTHWNQKGAFLAYSGLAKALALPIPSVTFKQGGAYSGDLVKISRLKNFPLHADDNWQAVWTMPPSAVVDFPSPNTVENVSPLSPLVVWVVGDSFSESVLPYLNATFKEIHYLGHLDSRFKTLAADLAKAEKKPDLILIVKVERSF